MRKELYVKLALGRSKSGYSIEDNTTFHNYIGLDGDTIEYLQEYETHSPLKTKLGAALREGTWQNPRKIAELIQFMYTNDSCKLGQFYAYPIVRILRTTLNTYSKNHLYALRFARFLRFLFSNVL